MRFFIVIGSLTLLTFLLSCSKQREMVISTENTLCAFIISDNNLDDHTKYVESDFVLGLKGCPIGTELFIYIDRGTTTPILRHLVLLESGQVAIKNTWYFEEQISTSPVVFRKILSMMIDNSSGREYELFYWSHGNGWLPGLNPKERKHSLTKSIGMDNGYSMYIQDFAEALSKIKIPLITVLDACYMGSVEVVYELRNSTDYIITSAAETLGAGFPYHIMIPELVKGTKQAMTKSLDKYLDFCYTDFYQDGQISGMATLVDCSQMDSLAFSFRNIINSGVKTIEELDSIQSYDGPYSHLYYDLGHYMSSVTVNSVKLKEFMEQLNRTIIYKVTTPSVYNSSCFPDNMFEVKHYSGLSTYILGSNTYYDQLYSMTDWYKFCYGTQK